MSRLKGVFDVKMGQKGRNLRKNTPKTAKITTKKGVIIVAVKILRQTYPTGTWDYPPPTSLEYGQIANDARGNLYTANRLREVVKQMSSEANHEVGNPNLLYNGSMSVNQRGQSSYLQTWGYSIDGWVLVGDFNPSTKTLTFDASNNVARFGLDAISYMRQGIANISSSDFGLYTISASVNGVIYSDKFSVSNGAMIQSRDMGGFYFTFEKYSGISIWWFGIGVVPGETGPGSISIDWIKLEKGYQATNYTPKSYLDELNECRRYYVKIATWQLIGSGYVDWEGKNVFIMMPVPETMRVNPTSSTVSGEFHFGDGTIHKITGATPGASVGPGIVKLNFYGLGLTQKNQACCFILSDTQLNLTAEI